MTQDPDPGDNSVNVNWYEAVIYGSVVYKLLALPPPCPQEREGEKERENCGDYIYEILNKAKMKIFKLNLISICCNLHSGTYYI